jgi:hypothetical protein
MVNRPVAFNCPECGKPLKRSKRKSRYCCENNACSVIFVRRPDKQILMEITFKANARPIARQT